MWKRKIVERTSLVAAGAKAEAEATRRAETRAVYFMAVAVVVEIRRLACVCDRESLGESSSCYRWVTNLDLLASAVQCSAVKRS